MPHAANENEVKLTVRMPAELHEALTTKSRANVRSLNGEIVARLTASLQNEAPESGRPTA